MLSLSLGHFVSLSHKLGLCHRIRCRVPACAHLQSKLIAAGCKFVPPAGSATTPQPLAELVDVAQAAETSTGTVVSQNEQA